MKQIKLIVTDLDGTLFTNDKRLPPDFDKVLADLNAQGVAFAVATGRNFKGIDHYFTDKINDMYFGDNPPIEYAVVNFSDKSIRPLIKNTTWFTFGNFDVDCDFEENGNIDLLIHYCPPRYND